MVADYKKVWKALGGKFLRDGSANTDSIPANRDYKGALHILGCNFEDNEAGFIEYLSINMMADEKNVPSCEVKFNIYNGSERTDNPTKVETVISEAIKEYGKKINSKLTHIGEDEAVVWLNFDTEADAKKMYGLITKKYSEIDEISEFFHMNL